MLARRLPTILPPLTLDAALEVTKIHSAAGAAPAAGLVRARPFRAPHHSASAVALVGGGSPRTRPGEITLAHRGALFLDELAEFPPVVLDALRQPLEERVVRISRASGTTEFPADFLLVACCNPCPCGRVEADCRCSDVQRARYLRRLSAPLLDRFDLRLAVLGADPDAAPGPTSATVRGAGRGRGGTPGAPARRRLRGGATATSPAVRWRSSSRSRPRSRRCGARCAAAAS